MVAPLIGAGIRAAAAAARGLAKKFGKKTEEPRERFKSSYDKAKEAEDKIKAAAEKREKIKEYFQEGLYSERHTTFVFVLGFAVHCPVFQCFAII